MYIFFDVFNDCFGCSVEDRDVVGVLDLFVVVYIVYIFV